MAAALFYQHLSEKDSEFLKNNHYTKEEVLCQECGNEVERESERWQVCCGK